MKYLLGFAVAAPVLTLALPVTPNAGPAKYPWRAPLPTDSRSPCPGLNILANHGYINRNGRDVTGDSIIYGFRDAFGFEPATVTPPMDRGYSLCDFVTGRNCTASGYIDNITLLAEPHALEHDLSLSRQDYKMAWAHGKPVDNVNYNATIFQPALDLIGNRSHVDFELANEIRLHRARDGLKHDEPGWLQPEDELKHIAAFELGTTFSCLADPTLNDSYNRPQVRVDWFKSYFIRERLPWEFGYSVPSPLIPVDRVNAIASAIYSTPVKHTPSPLPPDTIGPQNTPVTPAQPAEPYPIPFALPYEDDAPLYKN